MNIVYITARDYMGPQFNGHLLKQELEKRGHTVNMFVGESRFQENGIHEVNEARSGSYLAQVMRKIIGLIEKKIVRLEELLSLYSLLPMASLEIYFSDWYRKADIIHLQLPHSASFFSLFNLLFLERRKKLLWTMHDPWLATGHCVHPQSCQRWLTGCGSCPDLAAPLQIRRDTTALMWKLKHWILKHTDITFTVASEWMAELVTQSPIISNHPCHNIPFGIDFDIFKPYDHKETRAHFGIPPTAKVIAFRSQPFPNSLKGTEYIEKALKKLTFSEQVYLLTFETKGGLDHLKNRYKIIDLGWVLEQSEVARALSTADVFLMPSVAEAFGLMAIESMACGTPVIGFEKTALPKVIHAPYGGIAVPHKDHHALAMAIQEIFENLNMRRSLSEEGIRIVKTYYSVDHYIEGHINLYQRLMVE